MAASVALDPPAGGDESKVTELMATMIVTTTLALIVVGTRLFVRLAVVRNVGWDDFLILIAAVRDVLRLLQPKSTSSELILDLGFRHTYTSLRNIRGTAWLGQTHVLHQQ